ncbi:MULTISPECIES: phosphoribosylamine--glycine ligase [unclassified Clostridium]|uniref:phosphoribosylamine--glycine ligase n=1 Tax=unclassified Clostridium TaxID=2614128 RepID=UPI0011064B3E|nr:MULTISPECIES: phosphoribosylamine--glycine ligase [unclassified Clostridium]
MKVLVVGGGGREHAICWKLRQSPRVTELYCAPGNAGIAQIATCVPIKATDIEGMVRFAKEEQIDLTFVAPDDPLALGMVDAFEAAGLRAFGPNKAAARIEGSKVFAKELMRKYHIPTAGYAVFEDAEAAIAYLKGQSFPIVVKADGLALGKGVIIAQDYEEACAAVREMMLDKKFGEAGSRVVIEEFMTGPEVSVLAFTDGKTVVPMASAQDHKRALDHDQGLNTGGMGTFSPTPQYTKEVADYCLKEIFQPTVDAMAAEGCPFKGVLFFGLMLTENGPKTLEYNARFGDPETQVVLPRMQGDLLEVIEAILEERLDEVTLGWSDQAAVCVVLASGGYPVKYASGKVITGLENLKNSAIAFHAGTARNEAGQLVTAGGRVLGITCLGDTMDEAIAKAYEAVEGVHFENMHYRTDIGRKK